jgi:predicted double-glycine peptidase
VNRIRVKLLLACGLSLLLVPRGAGAKMEYPVHFADGLRAYRKVLTWKDLRDKNVVMQEYDYSCGSGALATLMWIGFGQKVSEIEIIKTILKGKTPAEIKVIETKGFSLLDLKQAADKMGYITAMYKLKLYHMRQLKGPVLIYFVRHGYKHFAVFKRIRGDRVYLADPARGNIRMSIYRFQSEWPGYILAIGKK